jgi:hypothetical protein
VTSTSLPTSECKHDVILLNIANWNGSSRTTQLEFSQCNYTNCLSYWRTLSRYISVPVHSPTERYSRDWLTDTLSRYISVPVHGPTERYGRDWLTLCHDTSACLFTALLNVTAVTDWTCENKPFNISGQTATFWTYEYAQGCAAVFSCWHDNSDCSLLWPSSSAPISK